MTRKHFGVFLAILAAGQACGGDTTAPPAAPTLAVAAGDGQAGMVGEQLPLPITVLVTRKGEPMALVTVSFAVASGGGTLSQSAATTNATGTVTILWTLGGTLGEQTLRATLEGSAPVTIRATAGVGPPAILVQAEGSAQFVVVNRPVPVRPKVQVTDLFGNKVAGATVTFSVLPGGGRRRQAPAGCQRAVRDRGRRRSGARRHRRHRSTGPRPPHGLDSGGNTG
jgi:hypothetical protein